MCGVGRTVPWSHEIGCVAVAASRQCDRGATPALRLRRENRRYARCSLRGRRSLLMDTNVAERLLRETDDFRDAVHLVDVDGMSSAKVCAFLNRLVASMDPCENYLEIGTWKGRTLLSAATDNTDRVC